MKSPLVWYPNERCFMTDILQSSAAYLSNSVLKVNAIEDSYF